MVQILIGVLLVLAATVGAAADFDADGVDDAVDNCPYAANADQADADMDGIGDVCIACGMLDAAAEFGVVIETTLIADAGKYDAIIQDMTIESDVCAERITFLGAEVRSGNNAHTFDVVAWRASGVAAKLKTVPETAGGGPQSVEIDGTLITGGGTVIGPADDVRAVDTTGTSPRVARCQEASPDAAAASAAFAAVPPNETHLDIDLAAGEELTLQAGTPGSATIGVVNVRSLRMHGRPDKLNGGCEDFAVLNVRGPLSTVVNISGKVELGPCAAIESVSSPPAILNVTGPGSQVRLGPQARVSASLLAPRRNVLLRRANNNGESPNRIGPLWARKAKLIGYSQQVHNVNALAVCGVPQQLP
jgi:hypothetical protein